MSTTQLMEGFPPASKAQVTLANWRTAPFNRWSFQHVREIVPSAEIPNDPERVWSLRSAPADFSKFHIEHQGERLGLKAFLQRTATDGLVVLHRGEIITEAYEHGMTAQTQHLLMSVSKSILGVVAGILAHQGVLDLARPVTEIIPELGNSAYAGAKIRDLLDMRAGVHFDENYLATSGMIIEYRKSHNWNPLEPGDVQSDLRSFFQRLTETDGPHGGRFHYVSPNTDLMGWVMERAAGKRYGDILSELLWRPMGAAHNAYITVDRLGAPRCAGGVCATVRDLARLGQLIVQNGRRDDVQIIPQTWIENVIARGDTDAWDRGDFINYFSGSPMHYRDKWYVMRGPQPLLFAFGVNGQHLFVDRENQIVIAKVSSQALPMDETQISLTIAGVDAIRRHLA
jgi:CubicO group peptidase (beta-lactamase class C family)